jgi:hypothetical protein
MLPAVYFEMQARGIAERRPISWTRDNDGENPTPGLDLGISRQTGVFRYRPLCFCRRHNSMQER